MFRLISQSATLSRTNATLTGTNATLTGMRTLLCEDRNSSDNAQLGFTAMSKPSDSSIGATSHTLIARIQAKDGDAWRRLVRLYGPLVDFWIGKAGLQSADAQDVFQDVFSAVSRNIGKFRKDRPSDSFRGWLRVIVRSKVIDHYRRISSEPAAQGGSDAHQRLSAFAEPEDRDNGDEAEATQQLRLRGLEMIRAEFEPRTWQMFWRVTVQEELPNDVASHFGVTPSAVRLAKSRVLRRLREELGDVEP